jgi:YggT family protein
MFAFLPHRLVTTLDLLFYVYSLFLIIRVVGSWFPSFTRHRFMRFVAFYTDPFLNLFRRMIPPIGGMLDLSPILCFITIDVVKHLLFYLLSLIC